MRKAYTKATNRKETKKIETQTEKKPLSVLDITEYFKDDNAIKATLDALVSLKNNYGWKIIVAYLNETKQHLINQLLNLENSDVMSLSRDLTRIQDQLKYIEYLTTLPDFLINSFREDIENSNLDPYNF